MSLSLLSNFYTFYFFMSSALTSILGQYWMRIIVTGIFESLSISEKCVNSILLNIVSFSFC